MRLVVSIIQLNNLNRINSIMCITFICFHLNLSLIINLVYHSDFTCNASMVGICINYIGNLCNPIHITV